MRFRKLRIAWSVFWGVGCVLLIVLWVRSYYVGEEAFTTETSISFASGTIRFDKISIAVFPDPPRWFYRGEPFQAEKVFKWLPDGLGGGSISFPFWFVIVLTIMSAATVWLPWRFSLRTLLIGMTLVALVLGWIVYATRH